MNQPHLKPPNSKPSDEPKPVPRWETAVMVLSFVAIWVWWLARQNAYKSHSEFPMLWNGLLLACIALLVWVFVRRLRRTLNALREIHPARKGPHRPN